MSATAPLRCLSKPLFPSLYHVQFLWRICPGVCILGFFLFLRAVGLVVGCLGLLLNPKDSQHQGKRCHGQGQHGRGGVSGAPHTAAAGGGIRGMAGYELRPTGRLHGQKGCPAVLHDLWYCGLPLRRCWWWWWWMCGTFIGTGRGWMVARTDLAND